MAHQNPHGKTLIDNWQEERVCEKDDNAVSAPVVNWCGHTDMQTHQNPHGKTLIDNWQEERFCEEYDNGISAPVVNWCGHTGIITTDNSKDLNTTVRDTYKPPSRPNIRQKGIRQAMLEDKVYKAISSEVEEECRPQPIVPDYRTTMVADYHREYDSDWPVPKTHHNLLKELPVSYWTDSVSSGIDGVTQVRTEGSPFKKNTAFSTPTELYQDQPKPYEDDNLCIEPQSRYL